MGGSVGMGREACADISLINNLQPVNGPALFTSAQNLHSNTVCYFTLPLGCVLRPVPTVQPGAEVLPAVGIWSPTYSKTHLLPSRPAYLISDAEEHFHKCPSGDGEHTNKEIFRHRLKFVVLNQFVWQVVVGKWTVSFQMECFTHLKNLQGG